MSAMTRVSIMPEQTACYVVRLWPEASVCH